MVQPITMKTIVLETIHKNDGLEWKGIQQMDEERAKGEYGLSDKDAHIIGFGKLIAGLSKVIDERGEKIKQLNKRIDEQRKQLNRLLKNAQEDNEL